MRGAPHHEGWGLLDAEDEEAAWHLADLLAARSDLEELRTRADTDNADTAQRLADLMYQFADLEGLRSLADADRDAAEILAVLLYERGDIEGLRLHRRERRAYRQPAARTADQAEPG